MTAQHLAHFNWGEMRGPLGSPEVAGFENAIAKVNEKAERSEGFVWRCGAEMDQASASGWPLFDNPHIIASFSVWETPEAFRTFVYETVHGAFLRRSREWFVPGSGANYALWWVPVGHIPTIAEARERVEKLIAEGPSERVFTFAELDGAPA